MMGNVHKVNQKSLKNINEKVDNYGIIINEHYFIKQKQCNAIDVNCVTNIYVRQMWEASIYWVF